MCHSNPNITVPTKQFSYELTPGVVKTFADPGVPFLTFAHFVDIVQWYRDVHFAPDNVPGFKEDIGTRYQVWTRSANSTYRRHVFPADLDSPITMAFEVPRPSSTAWFPLNVKMFDDQGLYFIHQQELVIERKVGDRMMLSSWRKVSTIRDFLLD